MLEIQLVLGEQDEEAVWELWLTADPELHRIAILHWLIMYRLTIGHHRQRLSPKDTVALIRQAIATPSGADG
ncbi:hypothetical protein ACWDRR_33190 [Kitasatospora sp. NPDC003701]